MVAETAAGLTYCDGPDAWRPGCGTCANCGGALAGGRAKWFCSTACRNEWRNNHWWKNARAAAIRRDGYRCSRPDCGRSQKIRLLEVNHKTPIAETAAQQGYTTSAASRLRSRTGCWNHLDNLETLCLGHHREETARQRERREGPI